MADWIEDALLLLVVLAPVVYFIAAHN